MTNPILPNYPVLPVQPAPQPNVVVSQQPATTRYVPPKTINSTAVKQEQREVALAGPNTPIPLLYGECRVGAIIPIITTYQGKLIIVAVWGLGEVTSIQGIYNNDGTALHPSIIVTNYVGANSQTVNATLAAAIPNWNSNFVANVRGELIGASYSVLQVPPGVVNDIPQPIAQIKGRRCYDSRTGTTAFTENPSIILADFLSSKVYGRGLQVNYSTGISDAANENDISIADKIAARRCFIVIDKVAPIASWVETIRAYAACFIRLGVNGWELKPDRVESAANWAIGKEHILSANGRPKINIRKRKSRDTPNVVVVNYTDTNGYKWETKNAVAKMPGVDTGDVEYRRVSIDMPGIKNYYFAYNEAVSRLMHYNYCDMEGELLLIDKGLIIENGDLISLTVGGFDNKWVRAITVRQQSIARWLVSFEDYQDVAYISAYSEAPIRVDTQLPAPLSPPSPTGVYCSEIISKNADGTYRSDIFITFTKPEYAYICEYEISVIAQDNQVLSVIIPVNEYTFTSAQLGVFHRVQVRTRVAIGLVSEWAEYTIKPIGNESPPTGATYFNGWYSQGTVVLNWASQIDIESKQFEIRYGPTNGSWSNATYLNRESGTRCEFYGLPIGTWKFYIKAIDSTGIYSTDTLSTIITIKNDNIANFGIYTLDSHTLIVNMVVDKLDRTSTNIYAPDDGTAASSILTANPLGTNYDSYNLYHYRKVANSTIITNVIDFGSVITGIFDVISAAVINAGAVSVSLLLSQDNVAFEYCEYPILHSARYAKVRYDIIGSQYNDAYIVANTQIKFTGAISSETNGKNFVAIAATGSTTINLTGKYIAANGAPSITIVGGGNYTHVVDNIKLGDQYHQMCLWSEDFSNAAWSKVNATIQVDASANPIDGAITADKFTRTTIGTDWGRVAQLLPVSTPLANRTFTFSIWAWIDSNSPAGSEVAALYIVDGNGLWTDIASAAITLTTTPTRYSVTKTFASWNTATNFQILFFNASTNSVVNKYCYIWGAQCESWPSVRKYVPTTNASKYFSGQNSFDVRLFNAATGAQVSGQIAYKFEGFA